MLPIEFFEQNLHFALNLFFSLVCFAAFWLYLDSWLNKKKLQDSLRWVGFLIISIAFLISSTQIEQTFLGKSFFGEATDGLILFIKLIGYFAIIVSLVLEPLQKVPEELSESKSKARVMLGTIPTISLLGFLLPIEVLGIALLYYRRTTTGLERHLRTVALAFFFLAISEALALSSLIQKTDNVLFASLTAAFGPIWVAENFFLLITTTILGKWVWSYLVKRLQSEFFIIFNAMILLVFLLVSVSFTFLLLQNVEKSSLDNLEVSANVLNYSLNSKKAEIAANTANFAQNPTIIKAIKDQDHKTLVGLLSSSLESEKESNITVIAVTGMVLGRADEPERWGDSLSSDPLVKKSLLGSADSNILVKEGVLAPSVVLQSAKPILDQDKVIGSVVVSLSVSNAFIDGIKKATGLDAAIYAGNIRSATSFVGADGRRVVGIKEENKAVKQKVLVEGKTFKGALSVLNKPYLAVYSPLKNVNNEVVGMLFTGRTQVSILQDAGASIQLIFILAAVLLIASILPSFLISRYISRQLH